MTLRDEIGVRALVISPNRYMRGTLGCYLAEWASMEINLCTREEAERQRLFEASDIILEDDGDSIMYEIRSVSCWKIPKSIGFDGLLHSITENWPNGRPGLRRYRLDSVPLHK